MKSDNYEIETTSIQTGGRGTDTEQAGPTFTWIKILEGYLGNKDSQVHTRTPSPGLQCPEDKFPQFWLRKPVVIKSEEEAAGALSSSSWGIHTQTHLLRLTPSELQHWGGSLKGTSGMQGENEVSGIGRTQTIVLC